MLTEIKKNLLEHPDAIMQLLEHYNYANIKLHGNKYITCGRDGESSAKSIVVWLENNDNLYVKDYPRNISKEIISFLMEQRKVDFKDVISSIKNVLGIDDYQLYFKQKPRVFGGFYDKVRKKNEPQVARIIPESTIEKFELACNEKFLNDNITLQAQRFFDVRFDADNQCVVIPIYTQLGQLMGIKERCNYDDPENPMKYWYSYPCQMSQTLYGFSQNYQYLREGTILVFESEKSVMQCYGYNIRNCVSLGSGSISTAQCKMLLELQPKRIIFLHDVGYDEESIKRNMVMIKRYSRFSEFDVGYWDFKNKKYPDKVSPSDLGEAELRRILQTEIVYSEDL